MNTYPLSQSQLGVYLEHIQYPESMQYNLPCYIRLSRKIDTDRLKKAIAAVLAAYPVFYTRIITLDGELRQYPDYSLQIEVPVIHISEEEVEQQIARFIRPFNLQKDALFRFLLIETPESLCLLYDIFHIIIDANNYKTLRRVIELAYHAQELPTEIMSQYEYAMYEPQIFQTSQYAQAAEYYKEKFAGVEMTKLLQKNNDEGYVIKRSVFISKKLIGDFCAQHEVKPSWLFMAALSITLSKFSRTETIAYASINHGRHDKRLLDSFGMFVKTVPILMRIDKTQSVVDFIKSHKQELASTIQQGSYPFTHFCQHLEIKPELTFGFQGSEIKEECLFLDEYIKLDQLLASGFSVEKPSVIIYETNTKYEIRLKYVESQYEAGYMRQFVNSMVTCIERLVVSPYKLLKDLSIVSDTEQQELISLGKGEELAYNQTETFIDLFQKQVALYPDSIAVVFQDRQYTYREIDRLSTRLAIHLRKLGVSREQVVGVMIDRSEWMVIYPLAIMKAGGAYMPLDYNFPAERLSYMVEDAGVSLILSEEDRVVLTLPDFSGEVILSTDVLSLPDIDEVLNYHPSPEDMYIVLYTSGSTGQPKGCVLEHHNLLNFCYWYIKQFDINSQDRCTAYANFGFDVHMKDLYPILTCGGSVYIIPSAMKLELDAINAYIENNHITIAYFTTQIGAQFATRFPNSPIRLLSVSGEKLLPVKKPTYPFFNCYGPTECTIDATFYEIKKDYDNVPIGRPMSNYQIYIVDPNLSLLPKGVAGELCIGGQGVSRGYLSRPELTAEKFMDCPFIEGEKMYRTGDLARWNEDGELEYLGRIDHQVKLRGFRIELGEIESAISKYEGIQSSVVEMKEIGSVQHLCGYYTSTEAIDEEKLRRYLSETLTDYMVPTAFMRLDTMPLTPNGKVNRKALPMPEIKVDEIVSPETELEQSLFDIVSKLLGITFFGVTTNLISMGLTSMGAIKLSLAVQRGLGLHLSVKNILQYPNIRKWTSLFQSSQEPIRVYKKREYYPLTELQQQIYSVWKQHQNDIQYNISFVLKLAQVDAKLVYTSMQKVLEAHSYLKVQLGVNEGSVVQVRHDDAPIHILMEKLNLEPDSEFFQSRIHPFNLLKDELYRMEIYTSPKHTYLFMDIHHIVFDGGSLNILLNDLQKAYDGCELLPESFTAYDYSLDYAKWLKTEKYKHTVSYFRELMNGTTPVLYPPSTSTVANEKAKHLIVSIPYTTIKDACRDLGVTESCFFLTALMQVLHHTTKEEHILMETIWNGRSSTQLLDIVGLFIQSLPVVSHQKSQTIADAMSIMQNQLLTTYAHDMYSIPDSTAYIEFNYHGEMIDESTLLWPIPSEMLSIFPNTTKIPLSVNIAFSQNTYELLLEYDSGFYTEEDMLRLGNELCTFIQSVATADPLCDITRI